MKTLIRLRNKTAVAIAVILLLHTPAPLALAKNSQLTVQVGYPNIWSLGQAHYLLSMMRENSRGLGVKVPAASDLDPYSANGARLNVLRTMLSAGGGFNGVAGSQNDMIQRKFEADMSRFSKARSRIDEIMTPYTDAVSAASSLAVQLAGLADTKENADQRKQLTAQLAEKAGERDKLKAELDQLRTEANSAAGNLVPAPTAESSGGGSLPDDLKSVFEAVVKGSTVPKLDASTALDNYVEMQYEVIAKQLTLLRDEVGPDQRLVFLELPMSLYSVPKVDDDYMVRLEWGITDFFMKDQKPNPEQEGKCRTQQGPSAAPSQPQPGQQPQSTVKEDQPKKSDSKEQKTGPELYLSRDYTGELLNVELKDATLFEVTREITRLYGVSFVIHGSAGDSRITVSTKDQPWNKSLKLIVDSLGLKLEADGDALHILQAGEGIPADVPITLDMLNRTREKNEQLKTRHTSASAAEKVENGSWICADPDKFRVVDVIPRQSALNVNDFHGTQNGLALTAKFLSVFGLGAEVGYQRQRAVYEQFMQQEVYASGFGKGLNSFGWTFGPLPGTRRIAPGVRSTYAIVAVPQDALALKIKVEAKAHKRDKAPNGDNVIPLKQGTADSRTFDLLIPGEDTEGFWVEKVHYTPVEKGQQATMLIEGKYFSPLTGIMINGVPLKRAVSIAKNEGASSSLPNAIDAAGEYEYLNPQTLVLSFKMGAQYVGTPLITLVTPEKTATINYFSLKNINENRHYRNKSLAEVSLMDPMFTEPFALTGAEFVTQSADGKYLSVDLKGTGLRPSARISIDARELNGSDSNEKVSFISPVLYRVIFKRPDDGKPAKITYRNSNRQASQEQTVVFQQNLVSNYEIVNYVPASGRNSALLDIVISVTDQSSAPNLQMDPTDGAVTLPLQSLGGGKYKVRLAIKHDLATLSVTSGGITRFFDIGLPIPPTIESVINATTGKPEGPANKNVVVTLRGKNLQHVVRVLFGGKEAAIMQTDAQVLLVTAPTADEGPVQVLVETNIVVRGKTVSNIADFRTAGKAIYTYTK